MLEKTVPCSKCAEVVGFCETHALLFALEVSQKRIRELEYRESLLPASQVHAQSLVLGAVSERDAWKRRAEAAEEEELAHIRKYPAAKSEHDRAEAAEARAAQLKEALVDLVPACITTPDCGACKGCAALRAIDSTPSDWLRKHDRALALKVVDAFEDYTQTFHDEPVQARLLKKVLDE